MSEKERALPPGWERVNVSDLARLVTKGTTPTTLGHSYQHSGILFVKVESLEGRRVHRERCAFVSKETHEELKRSQLCEGDVLYSIAGTLGRVAVVQGTDLPANTNQAVAIVRPLAGVDSEFLALELQNETNSGGALDGGRGVGIQNLNLQQVGAIRVNLPSLAEQRRIVAKLDDLLARSRRAKEALAEIPVLLERYRQSVLAAAFRGELTADWRAEHPDVETAHQLLTRIQSERRKRWENDALTRLTARGRAPTDDRWKEHYEDPAQPDVARLTPLPATWAWTSVETVGDVDLGRQRAPQYQTGNHTRPYLRVANIKDDRIDFSDVNSMDFDVDDFAHYELKAGDVLLCEGQSPELVGQSAIYAGEIEGLCFQKTLHRFRRYGCAPSAQFAQLVFRHYVRNGIFKRVASLTVNIAHLTLVRLKPLEFPLPPLAEQRVIQNRLTRLLKGIEAIEEFVSAERARISELDRSLLTRAFRGELVPQDPADEPASVLLDRLRAERAAAPSAPRRRGREKRP